MRRSSRHIKAGFVYSSWMISLLDLFCFEAALALGYYLWMRFPWHGHWQHFSDYSILMLIVPPLAILVFKAVGLYKPEMGIMGVQEQSLLFKAIAMIYGLVLAVTFFYREVTFSRLAMLYSMSLALVFVSIERYLVRRFFVWLNRKGIASRLALIYGAGYHGMRLESWIRHSPHLGLKVTGYLDDDISRLEKVPTHPPVLGGIRRLEKEVKENGVSVLFVAARDLKEEKIIDMVQKARELKIQCWVIPHLYSFFVEYVEVQHIGGIPLLGFRERFGAGYYEILKHLLDRVLALFFLILSLPLALITALGILTTSGPPIFFCQIRIGKKGERFMMYKFRTLKKEFETESISPEISQEKKSRPMTPFGAFLRKSGLDELPQLFNVLKGEMSLVGPRPEMPFLVEKYKPLEKERLHVKPGITGLWQVSEDRKRLLIHENMDYDLYYVRHMSFNLDLAILLKTVLVIVKRMF